MWNMQEVGHAEYARSAVTCNRWKVFHVKYVGSAVAICGKGCMRNMTEAPLDAEYVKKTRNFFLLT